MSDYTDYYPEDETDSNYDLYDVEEEWMAILLPFVIVGWIINAILWLLRGEE